MDEIIGKIKEFVKKECYKGNKGYYDEWIRHFESVSSNSVRLAEKMGANIDVVVLAAWLHDIGSIIHGKDNHHITGAEIADKKLREFGLSEEKIEMVKHCILSHRASRNIKRESMEAQILADADSMAHFENVGDLIKAEIFFRKVSGAEAKEAVRQKLIRSWNKISPEGRKILEKRHKETMVFLK